MAMAVFDIGPTSSIIYTNLSILSNATITAKDIINAAFGCVRNPDQIDIVAERLHRLKCSAPAEVVISEVGVIALTIRYCIPLVYDWMKSCGVNEYGYMMLVTVTESKNISSGFFSSAPTLQEVTREYGRLTNPQVF